MLIEILGTSLFIGYVASFYYLSRCIITAEPSMHSINSENNKLQNNLLVKPQIVVQTPKLCKNRYVSWYYVPNKYNQKKIFTIIEESQYEIFTFIEEAPSEKRIKIDK